MSERSEFVYSSEMTNSGSIHYRPLKATRRKDTILDPHGKFLQKWNKAFLVSCAFTMAWDALFFYIPVVDGTDHCLTSDFALEVTACVVRTITDVLYLGHMILQFRTGFVAPTSRGFGRGELVKDVGHIGRRYLKSHFIVDLLAVLPFPQMAVIIPKFGGPHLTTKDLLKLVIFTQYIPRLYRVYPLYNQVTRTSGFITERAWTGTVLNLVLYVLASHVIGAVWYLFSIDRLSRCWYESCIGQGCFQASLYCNNKHGENYKFNRAHCSLIDPDQTTTLIPFNFGMFFDALQSGVVQSHNFFQKLSFCFWWGLRSLRVLALLSSVRHSSQSRKALWTSEMEGVYFVLSSLLRCMLSHETAKLQFQWSSSFGQNFKSSDYITENLFAAFICLSGLILFSFLFGNIQKYLDSTTVKVEEMRLRRQDSEKWMSHRSIPERLKKRIRKYEQYKWQETRGVDEETVISKLPRDLKTDIKRHLWNLCFNHIMRVPWFRGLNEEILDEMCDLLKPALYVENSLLFREGHPVKEVLFIMRGDLISMSGDEGTAGFDIVKLSTGDYCGSELLVWAADPVKGPCPFLPRSAWTTKTLTDVEAFSLTPDDVKFVMRHLHRHHNDNLPNVFKYYSLQWQTWAACRIQSTWKARRKKELPKAAVSEKADKDVAAESVGKSSAKLRRHASKFAANAVQILRGKTPP